MAGVKYLGRRVEDSDGQGRR